MVAYRFIWEEGLWKISFSFLYVGRHPEQHLPAFCSIPRPFIQRSDARLPGLLPKRPKHFLKISENWTDIASFSYLKTDLELKCIDKFQAIRI